MSESGAAPKNLLLVRSALAIYASGVVFAMLVAYPELLAPAAPAGSIRPVLPYVRIPSGRGVEGASLGVVRSQYRGSSAHEGSTPFTVATTLAVRWQTAPANVGVHGASKGSPAVDDSGIYVGTDGGLLLRLDHDGQIVWKLAVAGAVNGIHGTPALDDALVYIGAYNGEVYGVGKADGFPRWMTKLGDAIGASPVLVDDDLLIAVEVSSPPDGYVARLRRSTGEMVWRSSWLGEQAHSSVTVDLVSRSAMVGANNATYVALGLDDGLLSFRYRGDGPVKDTGCLVGDTVYFTTRTGSLVALDARSGELRFRVRLGSVTRSSPTLLPGTDLLVVAVSESSSTGPQTASAFGIDRRSGEIRWRRATGSDDSAASALAAKGPDGRWNAWIRCGDDSLCAFDGLTGEPRDRVWVGAPLTGVPVAYGGSLYLSLDAPGGIMRLDPSP